VLCLDDPRNRRLGFVCEQCGMTFMVDVTAIKGVPQEVAVTILKPEDRVKTAWDLSHPGVMKVSDEWRLETQGVRR